MNLFQKGKFTSHSGQELNWKIECDALTDHDWACLAKMISERCQFGSVYGIPTGGTKLQKALEQYVTPNNPYRLVVDDVWTSPLVPTYAQPCERSVSFVPLSVVDEKDMRPFAWLKTEEVEIPYEVNVKKLLTRVDVEMVLTCPLVPV